MKNPPPIPKKPASAPTISAVMENFWSEDGERGLAIV
jgi:hypothetical protein